MHQPEILVLDEPTSGLDEASFQRTWARLRLRQEEGLTVLVTTHRPEEAERCQRLLVLHHGKAVACDTVERLRQSVSGDVSRSSSPKEQDPLAAQALLQQRFEVTARIAEHSLSIQRERATMDSPASSRRSRKAPCARSTCAARPWPTSS